MCWTASKPSGWPSLPLPAARAGLAAAIADIRAEELKQSGTTTGVTQNKRFARQAMCFVRRRWSAARSHNGRKRRARRHLDTVDFSNADLLHQTEQDCLTNCTAIYNAGNANIAALTTAGTLTAADLTDLNTKTATFNTLLTTPRLAKAGTKAATDLMPDKLDAADRICERQLDRLMERYKDEQRGFLRRISSRAHHRGRWRRTGNTTHTAHTHPRHRSLKNQIQKTQSGLWK